MHTIRFSDTQGNLLLSREYSADEASEFHRIEGALVGVDIVTIFKALLVGVRTGNLNDFAKDLFLPTYLNYAITIDESVLKIFASIAAIAFDLLFLPVRLFMCPFRIIRNATHPLRVHLIVNGVNEQQQGDVVLVEVRSRTSTNRTLPRTPQDEADGVRRTVRSTSSSNYSRWVNFIEIPDIEEYTQRTSGEGSSIEYEPVVLAT